MVFGVFGLVIATSAFLVFWILSRKVELGGHWKALIIGGPLVLVIVGGFGLNLWQIGAGWQIENDQLKLKAPPSSAVLQIPNTQVALVDATSPWRPTLRTFGYGTPGLSTGKFRLQNGETAIVFRHQEPEKIVVLLSEGQYYTIAHPGVEELYHTLLTKGAQPLKD